MIDECTACGSCSAMLGNIMEPRYQVQCRSLDGEPHGADYCW